MPYWHHELAHRPVTDKLVGVVALGCWEEPNVKWLELRIPAIRITNPNCAIPIAVTQMSIIRHDEKVIYEGPFLATGGPGTRIPVDSLSPHMSCGCQLRYCIPVNFSPSVTKTHYGFPDPGQASHWLDAGQAVTQHPALYTVEIEWWAAGQEAHPLIGFKLEENLRTDHNFKLLWTSMSETQMVNLKHY